jgi:hypothetical protein
MLSPAAARRLRRLVERQLSRFAGSLEAENTSLDPADVERQARALIALLKTLDAALQAQPPAGRNEGGNGDARLRRRLARRLEAMLGGGGPPRPVDDEPSKSGGKDRKARAAVAGERDLPGKSTKRPGSRKEDGA